MIRAITAIGRGRSDGCKWVQCHENPSWKASEWGQQKLHLYFREAGTKWGWTDWIKGEKECHVVTFSCVGDPMRVIWMVMITVWYIWVPLATGLEPCRLLFASLSFITYQISNIKCLKWKSERFKKKKKTLKFANDLTTTVKVVVLSISQFFSTCIYGLLKLELFFDAIKKKKSTLCIINLHLFDYNTFLHSII